MQDQDKTKEQLISELNELRRRTAPLIDSHSKIVGYRRRITR